MEGGIAIVFQKVTNHWPPVPLLIPCGAGYFTHPLSRGFISWTFSVKSRATPHKEQFMGYG